MVRHLLKKVAVPTRCWKLFTRAYLSRGQFFGIYELQGHWIFNFHLEPHVYTLYSWSTSAADFMQYDTKLII